MSQLPALLTHDESLVARIVREGAERYFAGRRAMAEPFVDRHFCMRGSLRLHRHALGWDVARAPANLLLAGPNVALQLAAEGAGRAGAARTAAWLRARRVLLETAVGREVEWLIVTEFLELPFEKGGRRSERDALTEAILAHPAILGAVEATLGTIHGRVRDPAFRARLESVVGDYAGTRAAASDIATALVTASAGGAALHQLTPGALSLGSALAAAIAQKGAVASFPLGATLGGVWFGLFPAAAGPLLIVGTTAVLSAAAAVSAAFAGVLADPVQRKLGVHRRRLLRLVDVLEARFAGEDPRFSPRDHYVARLLDLADMLASIHRLARA